LATLQLCYKGSPIQLVSYALSYTHDEHQNGKATMHCSHIKYIGS